jgi:hypothetical protein
VLFALFGVVVLLFLSVPSAMGAGNLQDEVVPCKTRQKTARLARCRPRCRRGLDARRAMQQK